MKLQQKIHLSILAVFIPLMIAILAISLNLKNQAQETFYQEAETAANFVDFTCRQEIRKLDLAIKAVLNDQSLPTSFHYDLKKNTLKHRCQELIDKFGLTLLAFYNTDGSLSSVHRATHKQQPHGGGQEEDKTSFLLTALQPTKVNQEQKLITFADQLFLAYRTPLIVDDEGVVGSLGFILPFPSETFFDDIYSHSSATIEVGFWQGRQLLVGSPALNSSHHYQQQRPTSKRRTLRLEDGTSLVGFTYPQLDLAEISGIVDLVFEILINTTPAEESVNRVVTMAVAAALVVIFIFSAFLFGLGHYIVKPLKSFAQAAKGVIEKGELPDYIPMKRRDEIGYLWSVGAKMATTLHQEKLKAEEANRAKSEFLANMSHEIRTPLNAILGFTQILQDHPLTKEEKKYLKYIHESGDHLLQVINEILDIAKIESGSMVLERIDFNINQLIDEIAAIIRGRMKPEIEYRLPRIQGLPMVCGDELKLKQVLINLINNANKFTEKGTIEIQVTVNDMDDSSVELLFFVRDTGKGIPADKQELVFKSFAQEDSSITRKYGGTGLGLTISQKFVELMGGRMWLESKPGIGTTFYFTVCLERSTKPLISTPISLNNHSTIKNVKIAVVDDNPLNVMIMEKILSPYEAEISSFSSASEFINHLQVSDLKTFDLIISDIQMPEICGLKLLTMIREQGCKIPVIAASSENILNQDLQNNFDAFIYKPIIKNELLTAIVKVLPRPKPVAGVDTQKEEIEKESVYKNLRILVAEDNKLNQMLIKKVLKDLKPTALTIKADGRAALDEALQNPYDLVLMDLNMPVMDGLTASREIRKQLPGLPIYALTANTMAGDQEKCLNAGMNGFLAKPINLDKLKEILQQHV